jgi:hypothetical protein
MSATMYRQCELSRPVQAGVQRLVTWLDAAVARAGAKVTIKDLDTGERLPGWRIDSVAGPALPAETVEYQSRDHVRMRDANRDGRRRR